MKANTASRTAQYMALYRAMETRRPLRKRLFTDPYAIRFLDRDLQVACRLCSFPPTEKLLYRYIQRRIPGALASGLARTRLIDDLLERTLKEGAKQVIILGAGFDTRSLRLETLRNIPVIEIDHPSTSRFKRQILESMQSSNPHPDSTNTRYLEVDLNRMDLDEFFRSQGIDYTQPTTLIWEGVTNYLQPEAIERTFAVARQFAPGSSMIFTYVDRQVLENPAQYLGAEQLIANLNRIEEPWTFGFAPAALPSWLQTRGWRLLTDKGAATYREEYLPDRKSILHGYEFYRVAMAS